MADQAGTSSAPTESHDREYDVFLNFRGPDTRLTVIDVLYNALIRAGIRVFYDDEEIRKGEEISRELFSAITNSKIYVPIFSKDYASSKWCLREIAYMVDLKEKSKDGDEKVILPVFFDVGASDVKLKTELYRKAMEKHEKESGKDVVKRWEEALTEVARIKGFNLKEHGLAGLVDLIQEEVFSILNAREAAPIVPGRLVGIDDRIEAIMRLLDEGSPDVRFIVIHGIGGIGKTSLAKSVYNKISSNFQGSCILSDIGQSSSVNDVVKLQEKLLSNTLNLKFIKVSDIDDGINMINRRLHNQKVLIILDDLDKKDHLNYLAAKSDWFGPKSRIIITTRNIDFLPTRDSKEYFFYQMEEMDPRHALVLFCRRAFENDSPPPNYYDISTEIVATTGGLPLALEVIGSSLYNQDYETWIFRLEKLKEAPHKDVQKTLIISYHALEYEEQQIFLDVACFFNNEEKTDPIYFWKSCKFYPNSGINILIRRSLIKVIEDRLWMHDQLRDLGRAIAQPTQCLESLATIKPSRLWSPKVALDVVQKKEGAQSIVALHLGILDANCNFVHEEFSRLVNLKFLQLQGGKFEGDFMNVFQKLRWFCWFNCPMKFQATNLGFNNLIVLKLSGIHIIEAWGGWHQIMVAKHLKVLNLIWCPYLNKTPSFSTLQILERLILKDCRRLKEIDGSIGELKSLDYLEISNGHFNFYEGFSPKMPPQPRLLPDSIGDLTSLTVLKIYNTGLTELHSSIGKLVALKYLFLNCPRLGNLPSSIGKLTSLLQLDISFSRIKELPNSIGDLRQMKILRANKSMVHCLPESIGRLESLNELDLSNTRITELPETIGNLKSLKIMSVSETPITKLPKAIEKMCSLEELYVYCCEALDGEIPQELGKLSSLRCLNLFHTPICRVPTTINQLSHLKQLILGDFGGQLPELPTSLISLELHCPSLDSERLPDLSNLANLVILHLRSLVGSPYISQPQVTTSKMEWLVKLTKLEELTLVLSDLISPPTDLSALSQLRKLGISCSDPQDLTRLPPRLEDFTLYDVKLPIEIGCPLFSNLKNVSTFDLCGCWLRDIQVDALGELKNLRILVVKDCKLVERLSGLSYLKSLRQLVLGGCLKLIEIQGLEEIEMLGSLDIWDCNSIQRLPDLLGLHKLRSLTFKRCESLRSLPDVANKETCNLEVQECTLLGDFKGPYHQFLDQKKFEEIIQRLEQKCGFYFDVKYFEDEVQDGNWDEVERYLSNFTTLDDNLYSMDMFYAIRKHKYLEALDRNDQSKAKDILMNDLKVFSEYCESNRKVWHKAEDIHLMKALFELYKDDFMALTQVLTWENFREHERFSWYGDTKSARARLLRELKGLIFDIDKELNERNKEVQEAASR